MTRRRLERALAELELTRRRRELLFWTLRGWLAIAMLAGLTLALLVALAQGRADELRAVLGAGGVAATTLAIRRRGS